MDKIFLELESMLKLNLTKYKINQDKIFELDQRFSNETFFHKFHKYSIDFITLLLLLVLIFHLRLKLFIKQIRPIWLIFMYREILLLMI